MPEPTLSFPDRIKARFGERAIVSALPNGETTVEVAPGHWLDTVRSLRDEPEFAFEQLSGFKDGYESFLYGQCRFQNGSQNCHARSSKY